jgi:hypothetical protein
MQFADRVQETTTTAGAGSVSLGGAVAGYQPFSVFATGSQVPYAIVDGVAWEIGYGTLTSGSPWTMSRDVILGSSNAGAVLTLSGGASTIFCTIPADQIDWPTVSQTIGAADVMTVQAGRQMIVAGNLNVSGSLVLLGNLVVL